jgi:hypothetical protein
MKLQDIQFSYFFLADLESETRQAYAHCKEMISKSLELLAAPLPDTFLGRQRHDLIPLPYQEESPDKVTG